jgi:hypothetical protein
MTATDGGANHRPMAITTSYDGHSDAAQGHGVRTVLKTRELDSGTLLEPPPTDECTRPCCQAARGRHLNGLGPGSTGGQRRTVDELVPPGDEDLGERFRR